MLRISPQIAVPENEIHLTFIRSPGPGGQNVNKLATAVQLRFDVIRTTSLSESTKLRLIMLAGNKITTAGELIIKANRYRTQERNKQDALARLAQLIREASVIPKKRKKTKPTLAAKKARIANKKHHSKIKEARQKPKED